MKQNEYHQENIAKNILELRKKADLTQEDLAKKLGISRATLSKIETTGAVDSLTLQQIADFFKIEITEMFSSREPLSKLVTGIMPPICRDVLGSRIVKNGKYWADRRGRNLYKFKKDSKFPSKTWDKFLAGKIRFVFVEKLASFLSIDPSLLFLETTEQGDYLNEFKNRAPLPKK